MVLEITPATSVCCVVVNTNFLVVPTACDREPRVGELLVIPLIAENVPPVRKMLPAEGIEAPLLARTWIALMVRVSRALLVARVVSVSVMALEVTEIEEAVISRFAVAETLPTPGLKVQPDGALRTTVLLELACG